MTRVVFKCTEIFNAQSQIKSQIRPDLPVILRENGEIVRAVLVIVNTASAETAIGRALQNFLKIGQAANTRRSGGGRNAWRIGEEKLPVKNLRKKFVQIDTRKFSAEPQDMRAFHPAHGIEKVVIILCLE